MGLKIHNYIHKTKHTKIEYLDTEEAETGKRKDMAYTLDDEKTYHVEHESKPITINDLHRFHKYNQYIVCDKSNSIKSVYSYCICTAKPQKELLSFDVEKTTLFFFFFFT